MNLTRRKDTWDPISVLDELQKDFYGTLKNSSSSLSSHFNPEVEIVEDDDRYHVQVQIPGLKKEDFSMSMENNTLTVKGEKKNSKEKKEKERYYSEFSYGYFKRSFNFETEVNADKISAKYNDGILEINVPKSEKTKPKVIQIDVK